MNDDTTPGPDQSPGAGAGGSSPMTGMSTAEQLLALGAVLVVGNYLLFNLILSEYSFFTGSLLVAGYVLFALWLHRSRPGASWPLPYGWLLKVLGYTAGFLGLLELLADLRLGILDNAGDIIAGLVGYAGALLMLWGARQVRSDAR